MDSHPPPAVSTLSGASVQTAEGNEFNNTRGDQTRVTQNFDFRISLFSAFFDAIYNRRNQPPSAASDSAVSASHDNSSNAQPQIVAAVNESGLPPVATVTDIASHANPSSQEAVLQGMCCTVSSLSPTSSIAEKYTVSMLECTSGYPLYDPRPDSEPSTEYGRKGIRVGDVGIVTEEGIFDFLFNVCPSQNSSINPFELPEDFEILEHPEISVIPAYFPDDTRLFSSGVNREEEPHVSYRCSGPEGAILELPLGATRFAARNKLSFKALAARHAEKWYKYTVVTRGRDIPNGSLYLITSSIKCTHWGIAVFNRSSSAQDRLQFVLSNTPTSDSQRSCVPYRWMGSGAVIRKVSPNPDTTTNDDGPNQCVFLRGYKIMLREDIWNSLTDDEYIATTVGKPTSHLHNAKGSSQGRGASSASGDGNQQGTSNTAGSDYRTTTSTTEHNRPMENDASPTTMNPSIRQQTSHNTANPLGTWSGSARVLLEAASDVPPLTHPSDIFNAQLLEQEPGAKSAITHDDDWCGLLRDISSVADLDGVEEIAKSYRSTVDEHGCAFLERILADPPRQAGFSSQHGGSGCNTLATSASTSSMEPPPTCQMAPLHHSLSAAPAVGSSLVMSRTDSAQQSSISAATPCPTLRAKLPSSTDHSFTSAPDLRASSQQSPVKTSSSVATAGPTLHAKLPSSTDHSSISAPDFRASGQKSPVNITSSAAGAQKKFHFNRISSQLKSAATEPEHADFNQSMFAKACLASLRILGTIVGVPTESMEYRVSRSENVRDYANVLATSVEYFNILPVMRGSLENLRSNLAQMVTEDNRNVEAARWKVTNYLQIFLLENIVTGGISPDTFGKIEKQLSDIIDKATVRQSIRILPCANAAFNDYANTQNRMSCFKGTRQALLQEVIAWLTDPNSNVYVLSGLAGIGKSTIAQTVAETADNIHLLGASFFFSRDNEERRSAKVFFTTIAYQLCVYDREFADAIQGVLLTESGKSAITKGPLVQLKTLILEPLRNLTPRIVVVVLDALDECEDEDSLEVVVGLKQLVHSLPSFKVILTTRPQVHLQLLFDGETPQKIFHLHNIEDKVVDGDIELYLRHHLSWEQVQIRLPTLTKPWTASDEDIQLLVRAAGRLFIIASTAVLFILDKTSTPKVRMAKLRNVLDQDHMPFKMLNHLYTTILRIAVPTMCERDRIVRYQMVIGPIIVIRQPLSIYALATLANIDVDDITAVLSNLQPVILLGSNQIPLTYHKSFPDYIQDPARCEDEDLRIDPRFHHTQMATRCLRLLNRRLKYNILDLGDPARFMDNDYALEKQGLAKNHVQEQVPSEMQYACLYFSDHLESADIEDIALMEELERFLNERLLNWLEALSWIGKLDNAHRALLILQKQLATDVLRFLAKFYDLIRRSALHTYHSVLPFTPTKTSFYEMYSKQMSFCRVLGGQEVWDGLITTQKLSPSNIIMRIIFSPDNTLFTCCMNKGSFGDGLVTIHDGVTGIPLGRIDGDVLTIANDFSKAAAFDGDSIMLYNVKGVTPVATIKPSTTIAELALSSNGSRLLAELGDGTVGLWDTDKCEQVVSIDIKESEAGITFSSDGNRAAFVSCNGVIKLLDAMEGKIIADLAFPWIGKPILMFSKDGCRLACLDSTSTLKVWNSRDGALIGTVEDAGETIAFSTDGSLLATGEGQQLKLWSGNNLALLETLDLDFEILSLAIHNDLIGIGSQDDLVVLDINSHAFVARLPSKYVTALAFSPDCTRLAAGSFYGAVELWDVASVATSNTPSLEKSSKPTAFAFSLDCSRLASGHEDGIVKLWDTYNMVELTSRKSHSMQVAAVAFSIGGGEFVSGSRGGIIQLWNGEGEPGGVLECSGKLTAVALSRSMLAVATEASITLWDVKSYSIIATLDQDDTHLLAFSHDLSLLATAHGRGLTIWNTAEYQLHIRFDLARGAYSMKFLPDDSHLAIKLHAFHLAQPIRFYLFDTRSGDGSEVFENQAISRLGLCPSWNGIVVWIGQGGVVSRFPQLESDVYMLRIPSDIHVTTSAEGSSMIALGCEDGRILLIKNV